MGGRNVSSPHPKIAPQREGVRKNSGQYRTTRDSQNQNIAHRFPLLRQRITRTNRLTKSQPFMDYLLIEARAYEQIVQRTEELTAKITALSERHAHSLSGQ